MRKVLLTAVLVTVAGLGTGACSGGNGTPFCEKARSLTKALGTDTKISKDEAVKAVDAYHYMADHIPKDLKDVTKKDIDDLAVVIQASFIDNDLLSVKNKVDTTRLAKTNTAMETYNVKHCDIVYKK